MHLDAGDSLLPRLPPPTSDRPPAAGTAPPPPAAEPPPDPAEVERRVRLMVTGLGKLGLSAFTPGENDLQIGPARLKALAAQAGLPVISANLLDGRGKPFFAAHRMVTAGGVRIGLFGVTTLVFEDAERVRAAGLQPGRSAGRRPRARRRCCASRARRW